VRGCPSRRRIEIRSVAYSILVSSLGPATRGTVIFLHGFAGSADDWAFAMDALRGAGYGAAAVDLTGHGRTDAPLDPERYGAASVVRDLAELVPALGISDAHWVGYSMGARVALRVALDAPERVRSLVLESASTGIPEDGARQARLARDLDLAREIETRGIEWFVSHWESQPVFETQRALELATREAQRARRLRQRPEGLARALRGLGQGAEPDLTPRLSAVRIPTLLLAGELDLPYLAHAERIASRIPEAERIVIGGAGHNIHLERPEPYARTLLDRLARLEGALARGGPAHA
jgi:2-succinyl-6-hydroxy-2,4-cyclohexadiene-1-carboxylate synthase